MEQEQCIKARLVGRLDEGSYVKYVFEDLLFTNRKHQFITMTKCPNWNSQEIIPMQEGFVTYKYVEAGKDTYWCNQAQTYKLYSYTAIYFLSFVPITHVLTNGFVTSSNTLKVS